MTLFKTLDYIQYHYFLRYLPKWVEPNHLTVFRFISVPFLIILLVNGFYAVAIPLFIISALSDAFDGALARESNQVSEWGKIFDPLADKLLIGSVAAIVAVRFLDFVLVFSVLAIELTLILIGSYKRYVQKKKIEAGKIGKVKMILQCFGVGLLLVYAVLPFENILLTAEVIIISALVCAVTSLFTYNSV